MIVSTNLSNDNKTVVLLSSIKNRGDGFIQVSQTDDNDALHVYNVTLPILQN